MSWDIVLYNAREKINFAEEIDESKLIPTDFCSVLEGHFDQIIEEDNHRVIKGKDFAIEYVTDHEKVSNKMLTLYNENALYELIILAKQHNWQIFDLEPGQAIDLEDPSNNGYKNFQYYLQKRF